MLEGYLLKNVVEYKNGYSLCFMNDSSYLNGLSISEAGYQIAYIKSKNIFVEINKINIENISKELGNYIKDRNTKAIKQYSHDSSKYFIDDSTIEMYREGFSEAICDNELEYLEYVIKSLEE